MRRPRAAREMRLGKKRGVLGRDGFCAGSVPVRNGVGRHWARRVLRGFRFRGKRRGFRGRGAEKRDFRKAVLRAGAGCDKIKENKSMGRRKDPAGSLREAL